MVERLSIASVGAPIAHVSPRKTGLLGEILVRRGAIDKMALKSALQRQTHKEVTLGELLCHQNLITPSNLNEALAEQWSLGWIDLDQAPAIAEFSRRFDPVDCLAVNALPWRQLGQLTVLLLEDPNRAEEAIEVFGLDPQKTTLAMTDGTKLRKTIETIFSDRLAANAMVACPENFSCRNWNKERFGILTKLAIVAVLITLVTLPEIALFCLVVWIFVMNLATNILRLISLWVTRKDTGIAYQKVPDALSPLPKISLLVPLHDEAEVLVHLLNALKALDYPRELLDVKLVLEASDRRTQNAIKATSLPDWIEPVVVPHDTLKTKPRAMNFALPFCQGDIIGVYDAEDKPDTEQLTLVARYLMEAPPEVACVQGYLDFYNPRQNWLSRCFTIEYSSWFRVLLRGVQRLKMPIPLGGTTVFFRTEALKRLGAWDAHNVTEDADLGIRLARKGYRCEMIPSTTREEANCHARAWIKQRSRWLKGYMITWVVHMRSPVQLWRDLGPVGFLGFQILFLGGTAAYLTAPLIWVLWLAAFGVPIGIFDMLNGSTWAVFLASLFFGQVVTLSVAARALTNKDKRALLPWVLTLPVYWVLGAAAALKASYELFTNPFYWDKTAHGLSASRTASALRRVS